MAWSACILNSIGSGRFPSRFRVSKPFPFSVGALSSAVLVSRGGMNVDGSAPDGRDRCGDVEEEAEEEERVVAEEDVAKAAASGAEAGTAVSHPNGPPKDVSSATMSCSFSSSPSKLFSRADVSM